MRTSESETTIVAHTIFGHWISQKARRMNRRGAVALEFAVVSIVFLTEICGIVELGYDLFVQVALDSAVQSAARQVQTGSVQGTSGETSAQFAAAAVCPALSGLLQCSLVTVGVQPIPAGYTYYTNPNPMTMSGASSSGGSICTGVGGQMMLIQAWYRGPAFIYGLAPSFSVSLNGSQVHLTVSSAAFVNEEFTGGQSTGTSC